MVAKSTKQVRDEGLDQFYTVPEISAHCISIVGEKYKWDDWRLIVEPSAGNGSFFNQIPSIKKLGLDKSPACEHILKMDFFEYRQTTSHLGKVLVIGNPPFGTGSSLATRFFNHASQFADVIAFIIPRTFRRISVQNRLDLSFHLVHDTEIPIKPCSFEPAMMVKCCFQIWEKQETPRSHVKLSTTHTDWNFLRYGESDLRGQPTPPDDADFAIRAYGGNCGEIRDSNLNTLRPKSWHFISCNEICPQILKARFRMLNYGLSLDTARQNSIGRGELVKLYSSVYS